MGFRLGSGLNLVPGLGLNFKLESHSQLLSLFSNFASMILKAKEVIQQTAARQTEGSILILFICEEYQNKDL